MTVTEGRLRELATATPMPDYPVGSARAGIGGVVVANVVVGTGGRPIRVDVLEAPDEAIKASVEAAMVNWEFVQLENERRGKAWPSGKITFYFLPAGGGQVLNPDEMLSAEPQLAPLRKTDEQFRKIDQQSFPDFAKRAQPVVVDLSSREDYDSKHVEGAINIPLPELWVRARAELPMTKVVVLDCSRVETEWCRTAATLLRRQHFSEVVLLVARGRDGR